MENRIFTRPMTSRDLERWRSWPQYVQGPISRKRLKIESRLQWNANRKPYMWHQVVTWPMASRDLDRSRSWPQYIWSQISRKRLEIDTWFQWCTNRQPYMGNRIVTWWMTLTWPWKVKVVTPICLGPNISKTAGDRVSYNGTPIGNAIWGNKWSHARWRHVTPKGQGRDPDIFRVE